MNFYSEPSLFDQRVGDSVKGDNETNEISLEDLSCLIRWFKEAELAENLQNISNEFQFIFVCKQIIIDWGTQCFVWQSDLMCEYKHCSTYSVLFHYQITFTEVNNCFKEMCTQTYSLGSMFRQNDAHQYGILKFMKTGNNSH